MFIKTNIPGTTLSFAGTGVNFGETIRFNNGKIVPQIKPTIQAVASIFPAKNLSNPIRYLTGNRCGHVTDAPRFYHRPEHHKSRPSVLEQAISTLESVYHLPKKFLKSFSTLNPNCRRKRSERREAVASVAQVLLHYLELSTLRAGFYTSQNTFVPLDLPFIAKRAGVNLIRARRAVIDLVKAGYIKVSRQFDKKDDGKFKGLPSIREISARFFLDLGIDVQHLFFTREWKRKEEKTQAKKSNQKLKTILKVLTGFSRSSILKRPKSPPKAASKELIAQAIDLHRLNPARAVSDYYKELQRLK